MSTKLAFTFANRFTRDLPADAETENRRRQVFGACYSRVHPTAVRAPRLIAYSREVAELLDLSPQACESREFAEVFAGSRVLDEMEPHACCYGGHQFGTWAGQLGDGRAINLGEVVNRNGGHWTLQLKGAGPTPYSRTADGLAVLRSSVREFLCSEAMHHLGVPTTRALSLIATGENVLRDMFYDGNPEFEPGAVVCRVAPSFTRFGSFEIFTARNDIERLKHLADFTIRADFPHLGEPAPSIYVAWFEEVCRRTADMVVHWMRVGFVHGVMNTDNMSVLGLTIDYGPYGWLEGYDPSWTPNTTDAQGRRYAFGNQPQMALWNLSQFARAIYPLIGKAKPLETGLESFAETYNTKWQSMMATKLGFRAYDPRSDEQLISELLAVLQLLETDMTIFFRRLAAVPIDSGGRDRIDDEELISPLMDAYYQSEQLTPDRKARTVKWLRDYAARCRRDGAWSSERREQMHAVNPKYVLRNYLAQKAIDQSAQGDDAMIHELLDTLRRPYDEQPERERFAKKRPEWARNRAGCSMLSCSS